ncbi:Carbon-nitrogen hydrolase [Nakaseomyces glabratus]
MSVKIAIGQLCSSSQHAQNLSIVASLIERAIKLDARVIFFPEATDYLSQNATHSRVLAKSSPTFVDDLRLKIKDINERYKSEKRAIDVSIGVHLPPSEQDILKGDDRVKNVLLYIDSSGVIRSSYTKLHLFDVESQCSCINYDIRFPELALRLRSMGAQILCYPSAFTMKTGQAHWELLGRARAIDTQCYVVMPGQSGTHNVTGDTWSKTADSKTNPNSVTRMSWGHSMIINPWGDVIARSDETINEPQLVVSDIDLKSMERVRVNMPLWQQRRLDLFDNNYSIT